MTAQTGALLPPDLTHWRVGNTGTEGVWRFVAPRPGPRVAITALIHGNELCGAWAASDLLALITSGVTLQRGELTVAFCNLQAFDRFDADHLDASRFVEEDMNRQWSPDRLKQPTTLERQRAAELLPWLENADFLLDLHSMHEPGSPLLMVGPLSRNIDFVRTLEIGGHVVVDAGHTDGTRLRDFGRYGDPHSESCALLIECGHHSDPHSRHVASDAIHRLMHKLDMLPLTQLPPAWRVNQSAATWILEVTHAIVATSMDFRFTRAFENLEHLPRQGTLIAYRDGQAIETTYDDCVLVMPSVRQLRPGVTVVRLAKRRPLCPGEKS